jgi:hypothetical protein
MMIKAIEPVAWKPTIWQLLGVFIGIPAALIFWALEYSAWIFYDVEPSWIEKLRK